jgi:hypothetical protein
MEIWIKPDSEDVGEAAGMAQIRLVKTQKILGTFEWSGFGVHADALAFTVLWRPDCRCFAISWEINRGYMTGAIYAASAGGIWSEVKLPSDEYVDKIKRMSGVSELRSGKGHDTPEKWLPSGELMMEFGSQDIWYSDDGNPEKLFTIVLSVMDDKNRPFRTAKILSIKLKPRQSTN